MGNSTTGNRSSTDLREQLLKAAVAFNGSVNCRWDSADQRNSRLMVRAYAKVYGISLSEHGQYGRHPLTQADLAQLPGLVREARKGQLGRIVLFRTKLALRKARGPLFLCASLYTLFGLGWGFATPYEFVVDTFLWVIEHPGEMLTLIQVFARPLFWVLLCFAVSLYFVMPFIIYGIGPHIVEPIASELGRWFAPVVRWFAKHTRREVPAVPVPVQRPYEIESFREHSPFGDASLAEKAKIARALQGNSGGFAPKFEE